MDLCGIPSLVIAPLGAHTLAWDASKFLDGHRIYRGLEILQGRKTPLERLA
jgi:hypothetical protein